MMEERKHIGDSVIDSLDLKVGRGPDSWTYIYVVLGFTLSIGGTIIQMTPLVFPWNLAIFLVFGVIAFWLFIFNGKFQSKLIGLKLDYENKTR